MGSDLPIHAQVLYWCLVAISIILHEIAHGYAALQCGDETAKDAGRLTLNPVPHIDPFGTILFPLIQLFTSGRVFLGWARPVPVNPLNYGQPRRDDIIVSVAGVAVNLGLAIGFSILLGVLAQLDYFSRWELTRDLHAKPPPGWWLTAALDGAVVTNIGLMIFNLIPIPPLDGSHVLKHFLPRDIRVQYEQIGFYGTFVLLALISSRALDPIILPPMRAILTVLRGLEDFVARLFL